MLRRFRKLLYTPYHYRDEYLEVLRKVNAGMLHHGNLHCFDYAIQRLPSNSPIIEIGTFCGLSANAMAYFKRLHAKSNVIVSTDSWSKATMSGTVGQSGISFEEMDRYVKQSRRRNLEFFSMGDIPYSLDSTSDAFFEDWRSGRTRVDLFNRELRLGGRISCAYIDGNHSYEYVARDFHNCDQHLEIGGFILFDDSADFSEWEVRRVIKEVKRSKRYRVILKNPNYLFQKVAEE